MQINNHRSSQPEIGILEWFRPGEYEEVEQAIQDMKDLGIDKLRTGISWADWYTSDAPKWFDWMWKKLGTAVEVLPCFLYTPPSLGEVPKTSSPPRNLKSYADFIDIMITRYGDYFEWAELWNEPNNTLEYDFTRDYSWSKFSTMIRMASYWAQHRGKKTLLGGMSPIDPNWLRMMAENGTLEFIDAIGIHGFPEVFDEQWNGWDEKIQEVRDVLDHFKMKKEIWISEVGFSTWQHDEVKQYREFLNVLNTDADRVYWYGLKDLDPALATTVGFHLDERDYHFGLKTAREKKKLLFRLIEDEGLENIRNLPHIQKHYHPPAGDSYILITGGAGFVGTNLAEKLLRAGHRVMIYDNLSREGVMTNLSWLQKNFGDQLIIQIADIREQEILRQSIRKASAVFHFSAQVAVTTSLTDPTIDFDVNIRGTLNVLEAIRHSDHQPPLIFTSTNKVYGDLHEITFLNKNTRYTPENPTIRQHGISEKQPLVFHSPYGCSKGAADQYVLDYCKSYGLQSTVFRMSCIYGPHQFGNEDQGWVAHFLISTLTDQPITIDGNGHQVRDILYIDDLTDAFLLALQNIENIAGEAFNIGGGPRNSISLIELLGLIEDQIGAMTEIQFDSWRRGDQQYYVSDTSKFEKATGWKPRHTVREGVKNLHQWLVKNRNLEPERLLETQ